MMTTLSTAAGFLFLKEVRMHRTDEELWIDIGGEG